MSHATSLSLEALSEATDPAAVTTRLTGSNWQLTRALLLVGLFMAWSHAWDLLSQHYRLGELSFASPVKLGLYWLRLLVPLGGIVGVGCVVLGRTNLRELGWRFVNPLRLSLLGLGLAMILVIMVFCGLLRPRGLGRCHGAGGGDLDHAGG